MLARRRALRGCVSPYSVTVALPGTYTLSVRAVNIEGGADPTPATRQWTVSAYPDTILDATPPNPSEDSTATFEFSSDQDGVTYECALDEAVDDQVWVPCTSPKEYTGLIYGEHAFAVRAIDALGHADPEPAEYEWDVAIAAPPVEITSGPAADGQHERDVRVLRGRHQPGVRVLARRR